MLRFTKKRIKMKNLKNKISLALLVTILPSIVYGAGIEKANVLMENLYTAFHSLAVITVTLAVLYIGYKVMFGGRALQDFGQIIIGAVLIVSAAEIGAYFVG